MQTSRIRHYLRHGTLSQLSVFETAARLGSYTRAAEALYMSQPTVSVQIRKLSETVGLPLFVHAGKRIRLTEAGRELYAACVDIFGRVEQAEARFADLRGLRSGTLQLAVGTAGKYFAPHMLGAFAKVHPGVEVSLQIHHRETLIERMIRSEDDLYIFANPPTGERIITRSILPNPMVAFATIDHPLSRQDRIPFARFAEEPFLMREPGSGTRMVALEAFARHGLTPRVRMELSTNEAIKQAILGGLGVSILPRDTLGLGTGQEQLHVLDVEGLPIAREWHFVHLADRQLSIAAQAFLEFACTQARGVAPNRPEADEKPQESGVSIPL